MLYYNTSSLNKIDIDMTSVYLFLLIQLFLFSCFLIMLKEDELREILKSSILHRKINCFMINRFYFNITSFDEIYFYENEYQPLFKYIWNGMKK